jgi:O-antigen/teichoic acid export membrane protein
MEYLNLSDVVGFALFQMFLILSIFNAVNSAFFQGLQNFICIAFLGVLAVVLKIFISGGLILAGLQLNGALLGIVGSLLLVLSIGTVMLINQLPDADIKVNFRLRLTIFKQSYPVFVAAIATAAMTQLDMVLVNWYFTAKEASLYAAASVLGKAILYLPGGLIVILFPMVSELKARGENGFRIFRQAFIATIICCGAVSTLYFFFSDFIINIFFGQRYDGAGNILKWYGFAILPMTLVLIAEHYLIAKGKVLFAWLFLAVAPLQILAIYFWHSQLLVVLLCMGIFGGLLALIGYLFMYLESKVVQVSYN